MSRVPYALLLSYLIVLLACACTDQSPLVGSASSVPASSQQRAASFQAAGYVLTPAGWFTSPASTRSPRAPESAWTRL